jgi:hypothetical protein
MNTDDTKPKQIMKKKKAIKKVGPEIKPNLKKV